MQGEIDKTLLEIVSGLAWLISGLDHSLPYGFKGKRALDFAENLQILKGDEIRRHTVAIADAVNAVTAGTLEGYWPGGANRYETEWTNRRVNEALRVLSPTEYPGVIEYNYITMGYAIEAIDRYRILMHGALERFDSALSSVLGDTERSIPRICELRARWEASERSLTDVLMHLRTRLSDDIKRMREVDSR